MAAYNKGAFVDALQDPTNAGHASSQRKQLERRRGHQPRVWRGENAHGNQPRGESCDGNDAVQSSSSTSDLQDPTVHKVFGVQDCLGLADYLLDDLPVEDLLVHPGIGRFVLFARGESHFKLDRNTDVA